jgi:cathepsin B
MSVLSGTLLVLGVALLVSPASAAFAGSARDRFATREAYASHLNAQPGMTWTAGVPTRFRGTPIGHSASLCGAKRLEDSSLDALVEAGAVVDFRGIINITEGITGAAPEPPDAFDAEAHWPMCKATIGDIRDQSDCGCCWAFAAAGAASDRMCIATNGSVVVPLSAQQLCFCASDDGCQGNNLYQLWMYITTEGLATGGQYNGTGPLIPQKGESAWCSDYTLPHCHHHGPQGNDPFPAEGTKGCPKVVVGGSPACPKDCDAESARIKSTDTYVASGSPMIVGGEGAEKGIRQAIMAGGPLEAAFDVYESFEQYTGGIYQMNPETSGKLMGGHAVRIVGWGSENGTKYWKIANSWNMHWGEDGYFRILRSDSGAGTSGPGCNIERNVIGSQNDATWSKKGGN